MACGSAASPAAPATSSSPTALPPATSSAPFVLDLPIAESDSASQAYAIWPFGVHDGSHGLDGHLGFDIEYRIGARVLAAADGIVASVTADPHDPSRRVVDLRHPSARGTYTTGYSNLVDLPATIVTGAPVARGEALGTAGAERARVLPGLRDAAFDFGRLVGLVDHCSVALAPLALIWL